MKFIYKKDSFFNNIPLLLGCTILVFLVMLYFSYLTSGMDWTPFWQLEVCKFIVYLPKGGGGSMDVDVCARDFYGFTGLYLLFGVVLLFVSLCYWVFQWLKRRK